MNDGRIFVGEFENDSVHGNGTMYFKSGNRHVGKWNHGAPDGRCVQYYANGTKSLVEYRNGEEIHLAGPIKADENFPEDKDATKSKSPMVDGKSKSPMVESKKKSSSVKPKTKSTKKRVVKTKGERVKNAQTIEYPDGRKYIGEVKNGKCHGIGTIYYTSGDYYDGEWKNDDICGEGTLYFPENTTYCNSDGSEFKVKAGSRIEGIWKNLGNGKRLTLVLPGGTKKKIKVKHGNFILK